MTDESSGLRLDPAADGVVHHYLADISTRLRGPEWARAEIVAELEDGLLEAVDAYVARGLPPPAAADAAVTEFGDPPEVAAAFTPELVAVQARRVALMLIHTGPLVGLLWILAFVASPVPPWRHHPPGMWTALPLLVLAISAAVVAAILAIATTGRLGRWLSVQPRLAPTAAAVAGFICTAFDLSMLMLVIAWAVSGPRSLALAPAIVAGMASLVRLTLAGRAARRCLTARTGLA